MPVLRTNTSSPVLTATDLTIRRGGHQLFSNLSVTVNSGDRLAIVGENGRGKSTLLALLAETLVPDAGTVERYGSLALAEQELTIHEDETVGDLIAAELRTVTGAMQEFTDSADALARDEPNSEDRYAAALAAVEAMDAWDADRRIDRALGELDACPDRTRLLRELSVGQRYRVRLACLLGAHRDFLLLDEPTNHLDESGINFLTTVLRERKGAVVLVSHDRALLTDIARTILDLDPTSDGAPRKYGDGYAAYRTSRAAAVTRWKAEYQQQLSEYDRLDRQLTSAQNRLVAGWRPDKGTARHQRASRAPGLVRAVHRRQQDLAANAVEIPQPPTPFQLPALPTIDDLTLVKVEDVVLADRLTRPVRLALESGSRLAVSGPNGVGKSTLLALLAGALPPSSGTIVRAKHIRIEFLQQESTHRQRKSAIQVYTDRMLQLAAAPDLEVPELQSLGLLRPNEQNTPVRELSMGQQRRLDLALTLAARPHVLLLDEPTNHLAASLVDEMTEAFNATGAAIVLATHDRQLTRDIQHWQQLSLTG